MYKKFRNDMKKYWKYAIYSAKSQLKAEIANSYLSWLWWILDPFCFMLIYVFIFGVVFDSRAPQFPIFVFTGNTLWNFFSKTLIQSVTLVKKNRSIVSKVYLPKYILLISRIGVNAFKMAVASTIIVGMLFFYHIPLTWNILFAIPILITLILVVFGFGCYLLHYGVFVEDLSNVMTLVMRLVFYMTGIFWDIMDKLDPPYNSIICKVNPAAFLLHNLRECVIYCRTPDWKLLIVWFFIGLGISAMGIRKIYKNENSYVKSI